MHRLIALLLFFSSSLSLLAQDSTATANTDAITYDYYVRGEWKALISYGKDALKRHEDFYYLRLRMGIAYYELKSYRPALHQFEKAYAMNPNDELLKEYLYYCYLYTEQFPQALRLANAFSKETAQRTQTAKFKPILFANAEYGMKFASSDSFYKPMNYFSAGLGFHVGRYMTAYNAYSHISQQMYYGTLTQHEYYATLNIPLPRSWSVMPAYHVLNYSFSEIRIPGRTSIAGTPSVYSLAVSKSYKDFVFMAGASYSNINQGKQYQQDISVSWYPLHHNKLMLQAGTILFTNDSNESFKPLPYANIRYRITPKCALSAGAFIPGVRNFSEHNAALANNSFDVTHYRINAGIELPVYKNLGLYALWSYEAKTESYYGKDYSFTTAIGGMKLIF